MRGGLPGDHAVEQGAGDVEFAAGFAARRHDGRGEQHDLPMPW